MTDHEDFSIVALGASAGGLEALEQFFENTPEDSGLAYIVIQHLSPDFRSLMDQLLARRTNIPIVKITDGIRIEPNHIYLLTPGKEAILTRKSIYLKDRSTARELTFPIDEFFRSLAHSEGERSIGIILSGTGTDGSRGIQDIHAGGGLVMCQDEESASFDGMPRSACATGMVDLVMDPASLPKALMEYLVNPDSIHSRTLPGKTEALSLDYMDISMRRILNLLNSKFGIDFSNYKPQTIARRVERRLLAYGEPLQEYALSLEQHPEQLQELYLDLLVGVTSFFRDREVFESLEADVIPSAIKKLGPDEELRIWCVGVATGEEAYSLAMLVIEAFEKIGQPCRARIFASDVHQGSLTRASQAVYTPEQVEGIFPRRLQRFFEERPEGFRVTADLRKLVVFTSHNVIHDAPFTRLDLITCRNVLIYFNNPTQQKTLGLLSFGLKNGGTLCLGSSESLGEFAADFDDVSQRRRIFRKKRESSRPITSRTPTRLQTSLQRALKGAEKSVQSQQQIRDVNPRSLLETYDRVLADYMPPGLLITRSRQLVHTFEGAARFLVHRDGRPSTDVLDYVDENLKPVIATAIRRACRKNQPVSYPGLKVQTQSGEETIRVIVTPYSNNEREIQHVLILFEGDQVERAEPLTEFVGSSTAREEVEALDRELQITRENLQASIEELQATNEQHQSANEELTAANEELQSTNEELHSVNEELYTVNAEHQRKIDELTELTDDMDNLLATTNVHTLFLDGELRLRRFTPRIAEFFNLIRQDVGRRIDSFSNNLVDDNLVDEIRGVVDSEQPFEREVQDQNGAWYLLRIFPYLSRGNVEGVVLTLVDIDSIKQMMEAVRLSEQRFNLAVRGSNEGIWDWQDIAQEPVWCSNRLYELLGFQNTSTEMTISLWKDLLHEDDRDHVEKSLDNHLAFGSPFNVECRMECGDGKHRWFHYCGAAERDADGRAVRMAGSLEDITERRRAREEVRQAVVRRDQFLAMLSHELRNPLGAILNAVEVLGHSDETDNAPLEIVTRQARQMAHLLDDLLDVSRIAHGKIELNRHVIELQQIVKNSVQVIRPMFAVQELEFSLACPDDSLYVNGDGTRLEQVFTNLLTNAVKYTPPSGEIRVQVEQKDAFAVVRVIDTGVGIEEKQLREIFEIFFQSDETIDRSQGGMGVGLTLVKSVIDLHGGTVDAHSDGLGRGSEFIIRLPLSTADKPVVPPVPVSARGNSVVKSVALVEDNDDAREMLKTLLSLRGFQVVTAGDGLSGLEVIKGAAPDLALIDIGLPGIDGYELARRIRAEAGLNRTRLVALTGYGQASDRENVRNAGFDEHLVKPLDPGSLEAVLRHNPADAVPAEQRTKVSRDA